MQYSEVFLFYGYLYLKSTKKLTRIVELLLTAKSEDLIIQGQSGSVPLSHLQL